MTQPCLIAATPRAGRWNHRFLVPPQANLAEAEIAHWADEARRSPIGTDYLAAVREDVAQGEGGRSGKELLILVDLPMKRLSKSNRTRIQENLSHRLNDLEELVLTRVDWNREGRQTLVPRQELHDWYQQDVAPLLSPAKSLKRSRRWLVPVLIALVLGISSLLMAENLLEKVKKLNPFQKPDPMAESHETQDVPLKDVVVWAKALKIKTETSQETSLVGQLADKLEDKLFLNPKSQKRKKPTGTEDQARLQQRLNALYLAGNFREIVNGDLTKLLQHDGLRERVTELMREEKPDRFVFIDKHQDFLMELVSEGTPEEVKQFRELISTANRLAQQYGEQNEDLPAPIRKILDRGRWDQRQNAFTMDEQLAELAVPIQRDADAAAALLNRLATRTRSEFASFNEWHKVMREDDGLFVAVLEDMNLDSQDKDVKRTFYRLMKQLHTMLQRTTTIQGQSEIR